MTKFVTTGRAVAMLVLFAGASHAQSSTGSISGVVTDQNQAVIATATITITAPEKYARDSVEGRTVEFVKDFRAIT